MRISKSKFVKLISIKEHECKALEEYLEEKALEGWMLEDIICGFLIFKKNKPQKCKFAVDIFKNFVIYCDNTTKPTIVIYCVVTCLAFNSNSV